MSENARDTIHAQVASRNLNEIEAMTPEARLQEHLALRMAVHEMIKAIQDERDQHKAAKTNPLLKYLWDRLWRARELE